MDSTADRLANLSSAKRALLERLSAARASSAAERQAPIAPRSPGEPVVLTAVQRRLWLLSQLDPEAGTAYNVPRVLRLAGRLDVDALRAALSTVVARHEVLRTRILLGEGEPIAETDPPRLVELPLAEAADDAAAVQLAIAETVRPFDLATDVLLRALLIRVTGGDHLLVLTMHHVASDEGSRVVLLRELAAAYADAVGANAAALEPVALQYSDYAAWQRARESNGELEPHLEYWVDQLSGAPDDVDLPTDGARPALRSIAGNRLSYDLGAPLSARIEHLARAASTTTFTVMLASFGILLQRLSGQDDMVIGIPVTGRHRPELADVVGCFANTLALRLGIDRSATFRETLAQAHAANSGGLAHQDAPFDLVVERLAPPRDPGRNALFQVCYNHVSGSTEVSGFPALTAQIVDIDPGVAKFDFTLVTRETAGGLRLLWEFRADLFEPLTVAQWHRHFVVLLDAALAAPDTAVGSLPLLEAAEIEAMRAGLGATATPIEPLTLPALVSRRARKAPDTVAACDELEELTYAQLDAASDALALRLRGLGVGRGDFVAVCVDRSARMVAALLGVHKAGAAYLPLDPTFPPDRLAFMLADSGAQVAITQTSLSEIVAGESRTLLLLDDPATLTPPTPITETTANSLDDEPALADLAYAIYTSGSTGVPKGVLIEHGALSNFLQSMAIRPGCDAGDVLVAVTTLSFDIAALELFLPLVTGATVVVAGRDTASDPKLLARLLDSRAATILQATPSTWRMLLDAGWTGRPGLRMLCGGEALPPTLAAGLHSCGTELWNMYGPTETTIWSSVDQVRPDQPIRLGAPIANTDFLVVDQALQPVPVGVAGELLIGGLGLARGYHNRAELTAEKFVAHPLVDGARAYRTGDLVRAHKDGSIEFLGRLDHQVKVRGFRIELGEVERALASHPAVRDVVAVVREDEPGDRRLIGYVVVEPAAGTETSVDGHELRQHVAARLPAYMVPSVVVALDVMPRTPNGKTDRNRLPVPKPEVTAPEQFVAPRSPIEEAIAEMWCEVLRLDRVGVHDDFFSLGGHSLRITQVMSRIRTKFGVNLPLRQIYEVPTVEAMAEAVTLAMLGDVSLADFMDDAGGFDD